VTRFNMGELSKLLKQAEELKTLFDDSIRKRKASVNILRELADELMTHHNNVCIAQVAGSSTAVAGFVLVAVGFGLSFVTFGTSLILSGVGGGICAAGGLTSAGSSVAEARIQRDTFNKAQKIIDEDREAIKAIKKLWEQFEGEAQRTELWNGGKVVGNTAAMIKSSVETGLKLSKAGLRVGVTAASEGGEALFRGLSTASRVVHIGGFAFSAVLLPLDIYTLVTRSMEIDASRKGKKDKEPKAIKELRELADELEKDLPDVEELAQKLDKFLLM